MNVDDLRRWLIETAYNLYCTSLNPSAFGHAVQREMTKTPKPGDLVLETSTIWVPERDPERIGWLDRIANEPIEGTWDDDEPRPLEKVFHIMTLSGAPARWRNACFIRIPQGLYITGGEGRMSGFIRRDGWNRAQGPHAR